MWVWKATKSSGQPGPARRALRRLARAGVVEKVGTGTSTRYAFCTEGRLAGEIIRLFEFEREALDPEWVRGRPGEMGSPSNGGNGNGNGGNDNGNSNNGLFKRTTTTTTAVTGERRTTRSSWRHPSSNKIERIWHGEHPLSIRTVILLTQNMPPSPPTTAAGLRPFAR